MYSKKITILVITFILILVTSGCIDFFENINSTSTLTYEKYPTIIQYHLKYGYQIFINGTGSSTVYYTEDLPELLSGTIANITIYNQLSSKIKTLSDNDMIIWNETFQNSQDLFLGISADVISHCFIVSDLTGKNAMAIDEIKVRYSSLVNQYCSVQGNTTEIMIDPEDSAIRQTALSVKSTSDTNSSFQLAKQLFIWLKSNTEYENHIIDQEIQSSCDTINLKTGDCDDLSFLYIALCRAVSIPARFIRGYLINEQNNILELIPHVWVEVYVGNSIGTDGWIPIECAGNGDITNELHQNFGVEDAHHLRLFIDNGTNESMELYTKHISIEYGSDLKIDIKNKSQIKNYSIIESKKLCITNNKVRTFC